MVAKVTKITVRRNVSGATMTPIDGYLTKEDIDTLYEKWDIEKLGEPLKFRGGAVGLTAEHIVDAPEDKFRAIYGDPFSDRVLEIAKINASSY